jgi:hypothetical protein
MKKRIIWLILSGTSGIILLGLVLYTWRISTHARIVIEWSTASELDTVGFNIYRSDKPEDPGVLVNDDLIPAKEDAQAGADYKYTDQGIAPGTVYYYYLEDVSADGTTHRNGPVEAKAQTSGSLVWIPVIALSVFVLSNMATLVWQRLRPR